MYALAVKNLSAEDNDRGVPSLTEAISRWAPLYRRCVPNPVYLLSCEGERQLTGEAVAEVIDV